MFDRGKQGYINATQIGQIMTAMEQDFDEKTLRKLIRKFDADGSGKIEFDEFCALVYTVANTVDKETLAKELREAFRLFDKEGLGYITRPTMKGLLKEIAPDLSDKDLDAAIDEIDEDGSGKIEFQGLFRDTLFWGALVKPFPFQNSGNSWPVKPTKLHLQKYFLQIFLLLSFLKDHPSFIQFNFVPFVSKNLNKAIS